MDQAPPPAVAADRLLQAIALALLLLSAAAQWLAPTPETGPSETGTLTAPNAELEMQARYLLGLAQLPGAESQLDDAFQSTVDGTDTAVDRLRLAVLALALDKPRQAADLLEAARLELDEDVTAPFTELLDTKQDTGQVGSEQVGSGQNRAEPAPAPSQEARWIEQHGYFGELAVSLERGEMDAEKSRAGRLAMLLVAGGAGLFVAFVLGCMLAWVAYLRLRAGRLKSRYRQQTSPMEPRTPYLEAAVLAVITLQVVGVVAVLLSPDGGWPLLLNWLVLPALAWPLARGVDRRVFLRSIGWTRGRGFIVEMGCGVIGYIASAPLLLLGFVGSALVARASHRPPHHPILDWADGADPLELVLIVSLATLWAPVVEESLFRGAGFHYLRAYAGPFASALAVSVAFAALHPQGLAGLPFLTSLALSLALIREWRGSLIAPVTVHMIHNGLVMVFLLSFL